jgi:hypothetical protein
VDAAFDIPDRLPILDRGSHAPDSGRACAMEAASWLAGEPWSDHPRSVHPVIARVARRANDRAGEGDRQQLWPLIMASLGTGTDRRLRVSLRLRRKSWRMERLGSHAHQTLHLRQLWKDLVNEHASLTGHQASPINRELLGTLRSHLAGGRSS